MDEYSEQYRTIRKKIEETWPQWKIDFCNSNILISAHAKKLERKDAKHMPNQFIEIERKFLLDSFPTDLPLKEEFQVYQAYLSINPEVRIRRNEKDGKDTAYYLAIKSSGEMIRKEVEIPISKRSLLCPGRDGISAFHHQGLPHLSAPERSVAGMLSCR